MQSISAFTVGTTWIPWPPTGPADFVLYGFLAMILVLLVTTGAMIWRRRRMTLRRVQALQRIVSQLDTRSLRLSRANAVSEAQTPNTPGEVRHLWMEYDETFVNGKDTVTLLNTVDAKEVFNSESLANELAHSRGLAFMPSALTAFGVLGTFLGLAFGLSDLQLGGTSQSDIFDLQLGVQQLISGVSMAFVTSIVGVIASLIISFSRYHSISKCDDAIERFQKRVDEIFNRHTPESSLVNIEHYTLDSSQALNELHEKIGTKLQEAVQGVAGDMQQAVTTALESAIAPVLQEISSSSKEQAHGALENLMREFEGSFRELGSAQAEQLSEATKDLSTSAGTINTALSKTLDTVRLQGTQTQESVQSAVQETVTVMGERSQKFEDQLLALLDAMSKERKHSVELADRLAEVISTAGDSMKTSSTTLKSSTGDLKTVGDQWHQAAITMDEHRSRFADDFDAIHTAQKSSIEQLDVHEARLREVAAGVLEATETLKSATAEASGTYESMNEYQEEFLTQVKSNVQELQRRMAEWLQEYGSTVQSQTDTRMNEWNQHSREYAGTMRDIAQGLQGTLEEIDDLKGRMTDADLAPSKLQ